MMSNHLFIRPGEEEERAPFSSAPTAGAAAATSSSSRLALAERALAEVTAQRDEALRLLESARNENARLGAQLDRARSYKALYAAAHHVRFLLCFCVCVCWFSRALCKNRMGVAL